MPQQSRSNAKSPTKNSSTESGASANVITRSIDTSESIDAALGEENCSDNILNRTRAERTINGTSYRKVSGGISPEQNRALMEALQNINNKTNSLSRLTISLEQKLGVAHTKKFKPARPRNKEDIPPVREISAGVNGRGLLYTMNQLALQAIKQPEAVTKHYKKFMEHVLDIVLSRSELVPARHDHRFRDGAWRDNRIYRTTLRLYLAWCKESSNFIDDLDLSEEDHVRSHFILDQLMAAFSPSNWPTNPAAIKRSIQTGGKSRVKGLKQLLDDGLHNGGMPRQVKQNAFTVGGDLATTDGQIIYCCDLFEMIQYSPLTEHVYQRPLFLIPPQLNKYYVFDLTPSNSMVQYLLKQGFQVFVISWRVPGKIHAQWDLDYYITELEKGIDLVREVTGSESVNLLSACAGGLTTMALIGYLSAAKKPWVYSHSLFVTSLCSTNNSIVELLLTRKSLEFARAWSKLRGVMDGSKLAKIFMWMRPNELVWNFWVNNYLLGKEPPALDVTFWDSDSTCLPAGLHGDFIDMYLNKVFSTANRLSVRGFAIDFKNIKSDMFAMAGITDYIMPWQGCYESMNVTGGECTFVLSDGSHIQSVLRPPGIANIEYFTNSQVCVNAEQWLSSAERHKGSWWDLWSKWLVQRSGSQGNNVATLGSRNYPPLYPAPGKYVLEKV